MGWDPVGDLNDIYDRATGNSGSGLDNLIDIATQVSTFGLAGYKDGKFGVGTIPHGALEGVGEISGRNQARKALFDQKDTLAVESAARAKQLVDEQTRKQQQDVQASQTAGALQTSAAQQQRSQLGSASGNLTSDFLGL